MRATATLHPGKPALAAVALGTLFALVGLIVASLVVPPRAAAFPLTTCTLTVTSLDASGATIATASGPGIGGSRDDPLFNGGAIRAFLTVGPGGAHECFVLWKQLGHLGLTGSSPLSLRWVRSESVEWPCDPLRTHCVSFTGPLARLGVR